MRFTITGSAHFLQVLITIVAASGEVTSVKVKGSRTGCIPMGRASDAEAERDAGAEREGTLEKPSASDGARQSRERAGLIA
jgi:hypothetical protein